MVLGATDARPVEDDCLTSNNISDSTSDDNFDDLSVAATLKQSNVTIQVRMHLPLCTHKMPLSVK